MEIWEYVLIGLASAVVFTLFVDCVIKCRNRRTAKRRSKELREQTVTYQPEYVAYQMAVPSTSRNAPQNVPVYVNHGTAPATTHSSLYQSAQQRYNNPEVYGKPPPYNPNYTRY